MQTNDKTLSSGESYRYFKIVTEEVRNIAKNLYIPVVTACQINREGMSERGGSKATLTAKSIAESRGIFDTADIFITIAQTAADKKKNNMYISFVKNRNDRTGVKILFSVDYEHHKLKEEGVVN
jgi:galactitol-specific phosphotransferase system IIB component